MTLEGLIGNYEDLQRLERLEFQAHFQPGFARGARDACIRTLVRVFELAVVDLFIPYPGPMVTTRCACAVYQSPHQSNGN